MRFLSASSLLASTLLLALSAGHVAAQADSAAFNEARDLAIAEFEAHNFAEARAAFQRANEIFPNARTLRGIGMAEYELRNYGDCIQALEAALASRVRPLEGALRSDTETLLARARSYVAHLNLEVEPGAATVVVDGVPVQLGPGNTLVLNIGEHHLEFRADGRVPERRAMRVKGGERQTVRVVLPETLEAQPSSTPTQPPVHETVHTPPDDEATASAVTTTTTRTRTVITPVQDPRASEGPSVVPWVITGTSAVVALVGVGLLLSAQADIADVEDAERGTTWSELQGSYDAAPIKSGLGIALIGLGTAGIATGVVLALSGGEAVESSATTTVSIGVGHVSLGGSF